MSKSKKLTSIAVLSTLTVTAAYVLNRSIFYFACRNDHLYSPNGHTYSWRFGDVFYTKQGEGSPILLIHDCSHLSSDREFAQLTESLAQHHTVYTLDLPGCGRSEKPKMTYTNFLYVQFLNDFVRNVIGSKTNIITSGGSSSFAIMACQMAPELYRNLMLINPPSLAQLSKTPTKRHKLLKYLLELPIVGTMIFNMNSSIPAIKKQFTTQYFSNPHNVKQKYIELCHEASHRSGSASKYMYASIRSYFTNLNIAHGLKAINNSIFIVMGEDEPNAKETVKAYESLNPAIESTIISHTKHLPHLECPNAVLNICDIFF